MKSALCPPGKKSLWGGKGHQGVGGHEEVHGHMHGRNEDVKAESVGSCGQMLLCEVGQLAVLTEASCGERGLVEVQIGRQSRQGSPDHEVRVLEVAPTGMLKSPRMLAAKGLMWKRKTGMNLIVTWRTTGDNVEGERLTLERRRKEKTSRSNHGSLEDLPNTQPHTRPPPKKKLAVRKNCSEQPEGEAVSSEESQVSLG